MSPFDPIAHLPNEAQVRARYRAGVVQRRIRRLVLSGAAAGFVLGGVGAWMLAHPVATALGLGPWVLLWVALRAFDRWGLPRVRGGVPIAQAGDPSLPDGIGARVEGVVAEAGARDTPVYVTRRGSWAALHRDGSIVLRHEVLRVLSNDELDAVLHHELGHRSFQRLGARALPAGLSLPLVTLGVMLLVWPSVSSGLAALVAFLSPLLFLLHLVAPQPLSTHRQLGELCADLHAVRAGDTKAMVSALLALNELNHTALRSSIEALEKAGTEHRAQRTRLERLRARLHDPTLVHWTRFDRNYNGRLEVRELREMLRYMARCPMSHLEPSLPTGPLRTHPPMHHRILFLLREDPALRPRIEGHRGSNDRS